MERHGDAYSAGLGGDSLDARLNFEFERAIRIRRKGKGKGKALDACHTR